MLKKLFILMGIVLLVGGSLVCNSKLESGSAPAGRPAQTGGYDCYCLSKTVMGTPAAVTDTVHSPDKTSSPEQDIKENEVFENPFLKVVSNPLSTFSIDVDTASYSLARGCIGRKEIPDPRTIRIEEMINYFSYEYPDNRGAEPFAVHTEIGACPWNKSHSLILVGLTGKKVELDEAPASNLVFLIDVSGSMGDELKLPLLKKSLGILVENLREKDSVAIVVYAGASGMVLDSTPGSDKKAILKALDKLEAGGSTAGEAGINLAYKIAQENFIEGGNNRVILATDGDFNVGASSTSELTNLITKKREEGVFLSVMGFGTGNYMDSKMERLADNGNGNYAYIDCLTEAKKVFESELSGTLLAVAKDVKLQLEFNPTIISSYRLIGYENRILNAEDFDDDKKDAGELGAGDCVTALYEVVLEKGLPQTDSSGKYFSINVKDSAYTTNEILTVSLRYKKPDEDVSHLFSHVLKIPDSSIETSDEFMFATAIAEFGLLLKDSRFKGTASIESARKRAASHLGQDPLGIRKGFLQLLKDYSTIPKKN